MTVAVCLKCGAMKTGAWTPCPECHDEPQTEQEKARYLMASDQHLNQSDMKAVSRTVKEGRRINFVSTEVSSIAEAIHQIENSPEEKLRRKRFKLAVAIGSVTLVVLVIALVVWLSR
jgi:hypothetical protein